MINPIVQKIGNKLPGWKRNILSYPERETLIKMVLSILIASEEASFEEVRTLKKSRRPLSSELEGLHKALRLRWLWFSWDNQDRPWKDFMQFQDKINRALFFASTVIVVGDGKNTPFWEARWLNGVLAPNLFAQARYKKRMVHKELQNFN
jgi:hypothetical protein